ncbi:MAG: universal stress protein [Zoogloeaceae bacterium]|nr:universal stress protein [Zoogloeaceae bacterium]
MFKHFLIPTDGSELSFQTTQRAVSLAKEVGARVTFFFSKPEYPVAFYGEGALIDPTTPEKFAETADNQAREIFAQAEQLAKDAGIAFDSMTAVSDLPYEAIINAAEKARCDLIFMGSHGRRGIANLFQGSETQKVLTHSKIPVLVYR